MKNKHYYPVAHSLDIAEIISIMCEEPSEDTFALMDEEFLPLTDFTQKDRRAARRKVTAHKKSRRETLCRSLYEKYDELKADKYHDNELLAINHSFRTSYKKPDIISNNNRYKENDIYKEERPYQFYTENEHERRTMFNAYCQDYLDCGDNIEPRNTEGYLIHVGEYSFHVYSPAEALYYLD